MGENSGIQWTTHTFNPWVGCQRVSPGCVWESINGAGSWTANPWVWVITFKRTEASHG